MQVGLRDREGEKFRGQRGSEGEEHTYGDVGGRAGISLEVVHREGPLVLHHERHPREP